MPTSVKVYSKVCVRLSTPLSQSRPSAVVVCVTVSWLVQRTVLPALISMSCGRKLRPRIATVSTTGGHSTVGVGVSVIVSVGVGVFVFQVPVGVTVAVPVVVGVDVAV